jgi:hypothetical protein
MTMMTTWDQRSCQWAMSLFECFCLGRVSQIDMSGRLAMRDGVISSPC